MMDWSELKDMIVNLENKNTPVPPKQVTDVEYQCSVCGSTVIVDDNYCHVCGQKLREV